MNDITAWRQLLPVDMKGRFLLLFNVDCINILGLMCLACPSSSRLKQTLKVAAFGLMMYIRLQCIVKLSIQLETPLASLCQQSMDKMIHWKHRLLYDDGYLLIFVSKKA